MNLLRRILLAVLLIGGAIVLAMPQRREAPPVAGRTVIRYWEKWSGAEADQMRVIVDEFNQTVGAEKGIYCQFVSMSQVDQKVLVSTAAGVPPDVAGVWGEQLPQFAAMNALEPLDDLASEFGFTDSSYKPVFNQVCTFEAKRYAMVSTGYTLGLYWNKDLFAAKAQQLRAAGLDPDRAPQSINELDHYSAILETWTAPKEQGGELKSAGYLEQQPGWWRQQAYDWFGGSVYDPVHNRLTLTDPRVEQAFEWMRAPTLRIGGDQLHQFSSSLPPVDTFDTPTNPFLTGSLAMVKMGPWFAAIIDKLKPDMNGLPTDASHLSRADRQRLAHWGVAAFPSSQPGLSDVTFGGADLLVIPSTSRHKHEAFEFIAFVNRQQVMEKLCIAQSKVSPLSAVSEDYLEHHKNPYIDVFERLARSPNALPTPSIPIWPRVQDELAKVAGYMVDNQSTAAEALKEAQDKLQSQLDDFTARRNLRKEKGLLN